MDSWFDMTGVLPVSGQSSADLRPSVLRRDVFLAEGMSRFLSSPGEHQSSAPHAEDVNYYNDSHVADEIEPYETMFYSEQPYKQDDESDKISSSFTVSSAPWGVDAEEDCVDIADFDVTKFDVANFDASAHFATTVAADSVNPETVTPVDEGELWNCFDDDNISAVIDEILMQEDIKDDPEPLAYFAPDEPSCSFTEPEFKAVLPVSTPGEDPLQTAITLTIPEVKYSDLSTIDITQFGSCSASFSEAPLFTAESVSSSEAWSPFSSASSESESASSGIRRVKKSRARKPCKKTVSEEEKVEKKKLQNREAASRYREKRRLQMDEQQKELDELVRINRRLVAEYKEQLIKMNAGKEFFKRSFT